MKKKSFLVLIVLCITAIFISAFAGCKIAGSGGDSTVHVTQVLLSGTTLELEEGRSSDLGVTVKPDNATNKNVGWASSNTSVATVSDSGRVKAISEGTAVITVTTEDGGLTAQCTVTVVAPAVVTIPVTGVTLDSDSLELTEGNTAKLTAAVQPINASNKKVTWSSSDNSVATVANGVVTAVSAGTATVTVTTEDGIKTATCAVEVKQKPSTDVRVTGVTLDKSATSLTVDDTQTLVATVYPADATNREITWSSDNTDVATVEDGVVNAISAGTATITVTTVDGNFTATCNVTVNPKPIRVSAITLDESAISLKEGGSFTLTATIYPSDATNKNYGWSSSDESVATVKDGTVSAISAGTATITVTTEDGNFTADCTVTVTALPVAVTGVTLNENSISVPEGGTFTLTATVQPAGATNQNVAWTTDNAAIATVKDGVVTAVSVGTAAITVTTEDGEFTSTCYVLVLPIDVTDVKLNKSETSLIIGQTEQLVAKVYPSNATNQNVIWSSDDDAVATVNGDGTITALSVGTATITAKTEDGNYTASCKVTVLPIRVSGVKLDESEITLTVESTITLSETIEPSNATNKNVAWTTDNEAVATVKDGEVTTLAVGTAVITVTTEDGGFSASCKVTVVPKPIPVESVTLNYHSYTLTLTIEDTFTLTATVYPADATNKNLIWSSDIEDVITVEKGVVTAVSSGVATITVTTEDGQKTDTCEVTVKPRPISVEGIELDQSEFSMMEGSTYTLTATLIPADATNQNYVWSTSNADVATVKDGTVSAISEGIATITVITDDGGKTATCRITVTALPVAVTGITLNYDSLELKIGGTFTLIATVQPAGATNANYTWTTDDASIASVKDGVVTAVSLGTTVIKAITEEGHFTAECPVTVNPIEVTGVKLDKSSHTMKAGEQFTLSATIEPANATIKSITWSSSDERVATVANGVVTAVSAGTAVITVTVNGEYTATCTVTVRAQYTVTFMDGDDEVDEPQVVYEGELAKEPKEVTKEGYTLKGWTEDPESGDLFDFGTPIESDLTLYAVWEQNAIDPEPPVEQTVITYTYAGNECAAFEWEESDYTKAKVEYSLAGKNSYVAVDKELIRPIGGGKARVDIVGLKGNSDYDFKITTSENKVYTENGITVSAYDRSGYAHFKTTEGVGAYNDDGTLKSGANVVYVTEATKNSVQATIDGKTYTGLVKILQNAGTKTPLVVRIIGTVGAATWNKLVENSDKPLTPDLVKGANGKKLVDYYNIDRSVKVGDNKYEGGTSKDITQATLINDGFNSLNTSVYKELENLNSKMKYDASKDEFDSCWNDCNVQNVKNVTVEGIGEDARIFQWGFTWKNCDSIEVRNLTFEDYTEDACSFEAGDTSAKNLDGFSHSNFWIHHNTFEEGVNYWDVCNEQDKHDGDGSTDFKGLKNITISYNVYNNTHKTGLVGGGNTQTTANVTFHHNAYNNCKARLPLARQANMHMYNNYYNGTTDTSISLRANAYAFIENCYFDTGAKGTHIELQHDSTNGDGSAKLIGCNLKSDSKQITLKSGVSSSNIYVGTDRSAAVTTNNKFAPNFENDSNKFYYKNGKSDVTEMLTAEQVKTQIPLVAGVQKRADYNGGEGPSVPSVPSTSTTKKATITVAEGKGVVEGDSDITVAYSADGTTVGDSVNPGDFKMSGNASTVTVTVADMKVGQKIWITVWGYSGSGGNAVGTKVGTLTNATATADSPEKVLFSANSSVNAQESGTFEFTANADGDVVITFIRSEGNTTRITKLEVVAEVEESTSGTAYSYVYGGNNGGEWATFGDPATTNNKDNDNDTALKLESGKGLLLNVQGTKATISVTGFTTSSSGAQPYLNIEFLNENGEVVGSITGTTPTGKNTGEYTFTSNVFKGAFAAIRFTCNTADKGCGILTVDVVVE